MINEIISIVQWFNPVVAWIGRELRMLHEFIADRKIVKIYGLKDYLHLLAAPVDEERRKLPITSFSDLIVERIQRLYQAPDPPYSGTTYLLVLPMIVGLVLTFSAPEAGDLDTAMDNLSNTKILTLNADRLPEKAATIQWGNLNFQIPLHHYANRPASYGLSHFTEKRELLATQGKKIQILGPKGKSISDSIYVTLHSAKKPYSRYQEKFASSPVRLSKSFYDHIHDQDEASFVTISTKIGNHRLSLFLRMVDLENQDHYILWSGQKYHVQNHQQSCSGNKFIGFHNQVTSKELTALLESGMPSVFYEEPIELKNNATFYMLKGPAQEVDKVTLIEWLKLEKSMMAPVVMQLEGRNGETFFSGFSEVNQPTIEYEHWQDLEREEMYFIGAKKVLKEKTTLEWGHLQSVTNMHVQSYPGTLVTFNGERITENHLTVAQVRSMLRSKPLLRTHDKKSKGIYTLHLKFIDHENIPFDCALIYHPKKGLLDDSCLLKILQRIKSDDFLEIYFYLNQELKHPILRFKIMPN